MHGTLKQAALTVIALLLFSCANAQHEFGPKLNFGVSYLYVHFESNPPQDVTQDNFPVFSGNAGVFYNKRISVRFVFGSELLFTPVFGKEYFKLMFTDANGVLTGDYAESDIYRRIYYLTLPVYFGMTFNNTSVTIGPQIGFAVANNGREDGTVHYNGEVSTYTNETNAMAIDYYDFGATAGVIYRLNNQVSFNAMYYYGMNNILEDEQLSEYATWKAQQLTVGIRYNFLSATKDGN